MTMGQIDSGTKTAERRLKVGVAGLGAGAVAVVRAMENSPRIELMAAADLRQEARDASKNATAAVPMKALMD
jgi:hypothetical protein